MAGFPADATLRNALIAPANPRLQRTRSDPVGAPLIFATLAEPSLRQSTSLLSIFGNRMTM
jgi:hypothetical protein